MHVTAVGLIGEAQSLPAGLPAGRDIPVPALRYFN
jgi:hypothetical protein